MAKENQTGWRSPLDPRLNTRENNWKSLGEQLWQRKCQTGWRCPLDPRLNTRENNWKSLGEQLWQRKYQTGWRSPLDPCLNTRENNWKSLGEQLWQRKYQTGWRSPLDPHLKRTIRKVQEDSCGKGKFTPILQRFPVRGFNLILFFGISIKFKWRLIDIGNIGKSKSFHFLNNV